MNWLQAGWAKVAAGMAAVGGAGLLALATVGGGDDTKDTTPVSTDPINIAGRWKIGYYDHAFDKVVNGIAFVDKDQSKAEVTLVDPVTYQEHAFKTENFSYKGNKLSFDLVGDWPGADNSHYKLGENVAIGESNTTFSVRVGKEEHEFEAEKNDDSDENRVKLTFDVSAAGMSGTWEFAADAQTGREKDGNGRVGKLTLNDDGSATQKGQENWWRPDTDILITVPVDDQMDSVYEHPDGSGRNFRELVVFGIDLPIRDKEPIVIKSRDEHITYKVRIIGTDPDMPDSYLYKAFKRMERAQPDMHQRLLKGFRSKQVSALAIEAEFKDDDVLPGLTHFTLNDVDGNWVLKFADYEANISFVRKASEKPEELIDESKDDIPVIVEAQEPMIMELEINGKMEQIELDPIVEEAPNPQALYEPAWVSYYPEEVYVQIATTRELPYEKLPIKIAVDGKPTRFIKNTKSANKIDPTSEDKATRKSIDDAPVKTEVSDVKKAEEDDFIDVVFATKDPDNPRRYLSPPIALVGPDKPVEAAYSSDVLFSEKPIKQNSKLLAMVHNKHESFEKAVWHFEMVNAMARTKIQKRPSNTGLTGDDYILTWKRAVNEASTCYGDLTITDFEKDAVKVVDSFSHYIVNAWAIENVDFERKTNILLGDHASMLLMRDTFTDMISHHMEQMRKAKKNPYGLYRSLSIFGRGGEGSGRRGPPILRMEVSAPDGSKTKLRQIFGSEQDISGRFGVEGQEAKEWQEKAIKEAIDAYLPLVESAHEKAWAAGDCEVQELINIVGKGFHNVVGQTFPRLMRVSAHTGLWEPDRAARAWVMNLHILSESLKLEEKLSDQDTQMILFEGAMLFAIPAAINLAAGAGAWALGLAAPELFVSTALTSATMAALDVAEFGYASYTSYNQVSEFKEELDFAEKSSAIIGYERFDEAKNKEYEVYLDATVNMLFATGGLMTGADEIVKTVKNVARPGEALAEVAQSYLKMKQDPKKWLGDQFKPWPSYSSEQVKKLGKIIYMRTGQKFTNLWEKGARLLRGPPKTSPEILAQIRQTVMDDLIYQRRLYEKFKQDPNYFKKLYDKGKLKKKKYVRLMQRFEGGERFFPDPRAIPDKQLDALIGQVADDIFEEGAKYGLKQDVMLYRAAKRIKGVITTPDVYEGFLGRVARPRLVSGAELGELNANQLAALSEMYDEVMKLSKADRELVMHSLKHALVQGEIAGAKALKPEVRMAYELARFIVEEAAKKPRWAKALSIEEYGKIKDMVRRVDIRQMLKNDPSGLKAAINDDLGLDVLKGEPFKSTKALKKAIERARKRIKNAVKGVYESANPKNGNPKGFKVVADGYPENGFVSLNIYFGKDKIGKFTRHLETIGDFRRLHKNSKEFEFLKELADDDKMFVFKTATLDFEGGLPNMINSLKNPMIKGKGTPVATYLNMRAMHEFGLSFADPKLKVCKLDHILNKKTSMQIDWLKRVYPNKSIDELIKYTHSYKYAQSALNQAGYKIKKALLAAPSDEYRLTKDAWGGTASFGKEGEKAFIKRYGYVDEAATFDSGHDFYLLLEPVAKVQ